MKLSLDDKEALASLTKEQMTALEALARELAFDLSERVLNYDLQANSDRNLSLLKSQLDGARRLHRSMMERISKLKAAAQEEL